MADLFEKVKSTLIDIIAVEEDKVVPDAYLIDDLGADSLDLVTFISALENAYTVDGHPLKITNADSEGIETVQQVVDMLKRKGVS